MDNKPQKRKYLTKKRRLVLEKKLKKQKAREEEAKVDYFTRKLPRSNYTRAQHEEFKHYAMIFLMLRSLAKSDPTYLEKLNELGYEDSCVQSFEKRHKLPKNYLWNVQNKKGFKAEYFALVTQYMSDDLPEYLLKILNSKSPDKAAQIVFPDEVGKALTVRKATLHGSQDDQEFRDSFFGISKAPKKKK